MNEGQLQTTLVIRNGNQNWQTPPPGAFVFDMLDNLGPIPGFVLVDMVGVDVDLTSLGTPGMCELRNQEPTLLADGTPNQAYVEYGIRDPATGEFYPLGVLRPGRRFVIELSPNLGVAYQGTGTGTTAPVNFFHLRATGGSCSTFIAAFSQ